MEVVDLNGWFNLQMEQEKAISGPYILIDYIWI